MRINPYSAISLIFLFLPVLFLSCSESKTVLTQQANKALEAGQLESAKQLFETVIKKQPESPDAIEGLLAVARISGVTEERVKWSRELLQYRPWHREANIIVGNALTETGNYKDAVIRLMLAYQSSAFQNEKKEVEDLIRDVVILTHKQYSMKQDAQNDSTQPETELR